MNHNKQIYLKDAAAELALPGVSAVLAVPLMVGGKSFGYLISLSVKRGRHSPIWESPGWLLLPSTLP